MIDELDFQNILDSAVREAFQSRWLMDQVLAVSAAHLNSQRLGHCPSGHPAEAALLQTKALVQFNAAKIRISADNFAATSLFSILLAMHVMYEALSLRAELSVFLERLADWFKLSRGVLLIASQMSEAQIIQALNPPTILFHGTTESGKGEDASGDFATLAELIESAGLDQTASTALLGAFESLHSLYSTYTSVHESSTKRVLVLMKWPSLVSLEFVQLMTQRCPQALVILAHYAILLHNTRYFWPVGDSGKFIVESITQYLGLSWGRWLVWPEKVVRAAPLADGPLQTT